MEPVTLSQNTFIALVRSVLETFRLPPTSCVLQTARYRYGHLRQMQANRPAAVASIAMRGAGICQFFFGWHQCVWHAAPDELALSKGDWVAILVLFQLCIQRIWLMAFQLPRKLSEGEMAINCYSEQTKLMFLAFFEAVSRTRQCAYLYIYIDCRAQLTEHTLYTESTGPLF